ncbi:hypothetical protein Ddc_16079 [Ditylenchus destructor]|nr:hypothetical protein Ddc_16079 [Ditylenchus destructor]
MPCFIPETLHDILRYCNRLQLCRISPTNRQFKQIIHRYFSEAPFISINKLIVSVNSLNSCPEIYLSFENAAGEHVSKRIRVNMEQDLGTAIVRAMFPDENTGVAPEFFRAQNVLFTFSNRFPIDEGTFRYK